MVELIKVNFHVDVICSARELGDARILDGITPDKWNSRGSNLNVLYIKSGGILKVLQAIRQRKPDVIYINGMFLPLYSWLPLAAAHLKNIPAVVSPRGMLQLGAMAQSTAKKKMFIFLLKLLRLHRNVVWQATDAQEEADIRFRIDRKAEVRTVGNVPKPPVPERSIRKKETNSLKLVFLSLITRKKNLDLFLRVLKTIDVPVELDIYGPVKDASYWEECLKLVSGQRHSITYKGAVNPQHVQKLISQYHAFVLLTKGENFGHAIYEALSVGTPAIISQYTPWGQLQEFSAGITVDINKPDTCRSAIEKFLFLDQSEFNTLCDGALKVARNYYDGHNFRSLYTDLFVSAVDNPSRGPDLGKATKAFPGIVQNL